MAVSGQGSEPKKHGTHQYPWRSASMVSLLPLLPGEPGKSSRVTEKRPHSQKEVGYQQMAEQMLPGKQGYPSTWK